MPAVAPGSYVVDVSVIIRLDVAEARRLGEEAAERRAVLVTAPSIVVIDGPRGPLIVTLGPGSLIFEDGPPDNFDGPLYRLRRREWIDGCRVGALVDPLEVPGRLVKVSGIAIAVDYRDPVALIINGVDSEGSVVPQSLEDEIVKAVVDGTPLLGEVNGKYVVHVRDGEWFLRLTRVAPMLGGCLEGGSH